MREISWKLNKARIWLNEFPNWDYDVAQVEEYHLPADRLRDGNLQSIAIEMLKPTGPIAMYGGLGATFVPEKRENLLVRVFVSTDQGRLCYDTLAIKGETAHIGFPQEYVRGLLEGVTKSEY